MTHCELWKGSQCHMELTKPERNPTGVRVENLPYPQLVPEVFSLGQTTRPRSWFLKITCSPWLDCVSIMMIFLHCVFLGISKPCEERALIPQVLDALSFVFFTLEMFIKVVALGAFGSTRSYMSNNWNKFDVFIYFGELLDYFLSFLGVQIHVRNVLRLMRLFGRVPSMRDLVSILVHILPMLTNVLVLFIFVLLIFSIVGVQLWAGQLRNRCFLGADIPKSYNLTLSPYFVSKYGERLVFICSKDHNNGLRHCHDVPPYVHDGETCSVPVLNHSSAVSALPDACVNWNTYYNVCRTGDLNPYMGSISFDNIGYALIVVFQVVTLEGWTDIMFYVMDAHSFWSFIFFILVTIMGSFIMMNVCAVVIATKFSEILTKMTVEESSNPITQLCCQLLSRLWEIFLMPWRCHNRVRPSGTSGTEQGILGVVWMPVRTLLRRMTGSKHFDRFIMGVIVLSVATIVTEHHGQSRRFAELQRISNIVFTVIFLMELILKLLVLQLAYFKDRNNNFDFFIVAVSLWEIIAKTDSRLSALRVFRLLRLVRLLNYLPHLKKQLLRLMVTMKEGAPLCQLLLFVTIIFSVIGMCLFGGSTKDGSTIKDRINFDSLLWSMVTVLQILTGEDWNLVLYNAMAATSPWAFFYFFSIIVVGKHVLLNILVGIVVKSFQDMDPSAETSADTPATTSSETSATTSAEMEDKNSTPETQSPESSLSQSEDTRTNMNLIHNVGHWCRQRKDWSFFVISPQNQFRIFSQRMICNSMFDHLILFFILLSCVTLAVERPALDPASTEQWVLNICNYVFSAVFLVEMLIKVLALGLVYGENSYCRSYWNMMDGTLVILSVVTIIIPLFSRGKNNRLGILKVMRLLRTLRPLRVIKRAPKLKLAVKALMASVKPIGNIALICGVLFFCYGLLGVQLFKGKFYHCIGEDLRNITSKTECLSADYQWVQKRYNFDNLPQALMALFVMYSKDSWVNIMYDGLDAVGVDQQPVRNHNEWMLVYFISFMILSFFLLDMFIGVMVETFHQCQQEQKKLDEIEKEQGAMQTQPQDTDPERIQYYRNYSPVRLSIHALCTSSGLDLFMTITIVVNVFIMAAEHYQQPQYIDNLIEYSYYIFTTILIGEVLLKLVAFGIRRFMSFSWNLLDVFIVLISFVTIVLDKMKMEYVIPINPSILRVCRALRLAQVLKARRIRVLLKTIVKTLSQVGNICLLFMFFFFIYAVLGVELFGNIECSDDRPCQGLHRYFNFKHFGMAMLTLYQVCTGDNWSGILKDMLRKCCPEDVGCLSYMTFVAPVFFITFVIMAQFVLVNLVVATIAQALDESKERNSTNTHLPVKEEMVLDGERALQSLEEGVRCSSGAT